jgi:proteasome accessory factor C
MPRPPGDSARDRLNLFLAIVPFVLARGVTNVTEIAERFGVPEQRVSDAIIAIACDGGANEARLNFDTELFNIDWDSWDDDKTVILTVAEALQVPAPFGGRQKAMFLAGLELLKAHPHYRRLPEFDTLIDKLRGDDGTHPTDVFAVAIDTNNPTASAIQDAIDKGVCVRFTYTDNKGERTERTVEPYRQDVENGQRYLSGWCLTRDGMRTFNLDSIESLDITGESVEPRAIDTLALSGSLFHAHEDDLHVTVVIDSAAAPLIAAYRQPGDKPDKSGERETVTIPFTHSASAIRMIAVLSGVARITGPSEVRTTVADFARDALSAYRASV